MIDLVTGQFQFAARGERLTDRDLVLFVACKDPPEHVPVLVDDLFDLLQVSVHGLVGQDVPVVVRETDGVIADLQPGLAAEGLHLPVIGERDGAGEQCYPVLLHLRHDLPG